MAEHTPGPWQAERKNWRGEPEPHRIFVSGDFRESIEEIDEDEHEIVSVATAVAIIEGNKHSREITEANARLIAAAPSLLEACKAFAAWDEHTYGGEPEAASLRRLIAAAIAKATGQEAASC